MPDNPYLTYEPHDSFDARGVLKPEAYEAKDQVPKKIVVSEEELERRRKLAERQSLIDSSAHEILEELTDEVLGVQAREVAGIAVERMEKLLAAQDVGDELIQEVQEEMVKSVGQEAIR